MAGYYKPKQYDWKDSNLALFGSDTVKNVKKESAKTEKAWKGAGSKVGLQIWRLEVKEWPKEEYGHFYNGDSYIILNTYKDSEDEELQHDVHFWVGQYSTLDEYGIAAKKTEELDAFLGDAAIQHREVQGNESDLFKSYFDELTIMMGSAPSGYRDVKPTKYTPRLYQLRKIGRRVELTQIPRNKDRLNSGGVFIMDLGPKIYQWNGSSSSRDEKESARTYCGKIAAERDALFEEVEEKVMVQDSSHEFFKAFNEEDTQDDAQKYKAADTQKELFRLSDASGRIDFSLIKKGDISKSDFDGKDVFILDTKTALFVWIGRRATLGEKRSAIPYAHTYLQSTDHPLVPVCCLMEGKRSIAFDLALTA